MHYKNGRIVAVGDWAVGPTHNTEGKIIIGLVTKIIKGQGNCSVRLQVFPAYELMKYSHEDERDTISVSIGDEETNYKLGSRTDFADAAKLVHVQDGYDMVDRVVGDKYPSQMM